MRRVGRRLRFALAPFTALLIVMTIGATVPIGVKPCNIAAAWVNDHVSEIPTTYSEFSKYPMAYRKYMYSKLPQSTKAAMWKEQLAQYLRPEANLSPVETRFVQRVYGSIDTVFDPSRRAAFIKDERLTQHAQALFGLERARTIFASLGPYEGTVSRLNLNTASIFGPISLPARLTAAMHIGKPDPNCDCYHGSDWCGGADHCTTGGCYPTGSCGTLWQYVCDGLCYLNS